MWVEEMGAKFLALGRKSGWHLLGTFWEDALGIFGEAPKKWLVSFGRHPKSGWHLLGAPYEALAGVADGGSVQFTLSKSERRFPTLSSLAHTLSGIDPIFFELGRARALPSPSIPACEWMKKHGGAR